MAGAGVHDAAIGVQTLDEMDRLYDEMHRREVERERAAEQKWQELAAARAAALSRYPWMADAGHQINTLLGWAADIDNATPVDRSEIEADARAWVDDVRQEQLEHERRNDLGSWYEQLLYDPTADPGELALAMGAHHDANRLDQVLYGKDPADALLADFLYAYARHDRHAWDHCTDGEAACLLRTALGAAGYAIVRVEANR